MTQSRLRGRRNTCGSSTCHLNPHPPHRSSRRLLAVLLLLSVSLFFCNTPYRRYDDDHATTTLEPASPTMQQRNTTTSNESSSTIENDNRTHNSTRSIISHATTVKQRMRVQDFPPKPVSPYEQRYPGHSLPKWATKPFFFRRENVVKRICFVHVGKAGGSSLGCALGFQLHCRKEMKYPLNAILPLCTTNIMHNSVNDCSMDMDIYMLSVRDPLERIQSWYVYDKQDLGLLRSQCGFKTLNDLAELGLNKVNTSQLCFNRARRAIRGEEKFGRHAYRNYRWYLSQVPSNASIAVIRIEHLLEDWNSMERLLGSDHVVRKLPVRNTNSFDENDDEKYLSQDSKRLLCEQLCDEIQVYKGLLYRAVNLNALQVEQSMQELRKSCPREADLPACFKS